MEISNAQAAVGILLSLAVFFMVLRHVAVTHNRNTPQSGVRPEYLCHPRKGISDVRVLVVSRDRSFLDRMRSLGDFYGWDLLLTQATSAGTATNESKAFPLVVCDHDAFGDRWPEAFQTFLAQDTSRCIILCSRNAGDNLWQDAIRRGGYDVVGKPLREEQIVRAVQFASTYWKATHLRALPSPNAAAVPRPA